MPIYEFTCLKCRAPAEVLQRVGDRPPACPSCGSRRMTRAVSRTSFHLKGGGWYADLYGTPRPGGATPGGAEPSKAPVEKAGGEKPPAEKPAAAPPGAASPAPAAAAPAPGPESPPPAPGRSRRSGASRKRR
jgi:putative FmdB family regulatory protein